MIHILPKIISVFRGQMIESLRFVGRDELAASKTAMTRARRTRLLVLLQFGSINQCSAMRTLDTNAVQKSWCEAVLAREEWFFAANWTRLKLNDTRRAENSSAFDAFERVFAELSANRALEFVAHIELVEIILFCLQTNKCVETTFLNFMPTIWEAINR